MNGKKKSPTETFDTIKVDLPVLAYVAGIVDGEGYVGIHRRTGGSRWGGITLEVAMTVEGVPRLLQRLFGGSVYQRQDKRSDGYRKPSWRWSVVNRQAEAVLRAIYPWLIVKRPNADICLAYQATVGPGRYLPAGTSIGQGKGSARLPIDPVIDEKRNELWQQLKQLTKQNRPSLSLS